MVVITYNIPLHCIVGAMVGGPLAGWLCERHGRRLCIISSVLPYVAGWAFIVLAQNDNMLYIGRFIIGIASGMTTLSVPLYIGEIASKEIRGLLGSGFQIACTAGSLATYSLGLLVSWRYLGNEHFNM